MNREKKVGYEFYASRRGLLSYARALAESVMYPLIMSNNTEAETSASENANSSTTQAASQVRYTRLTPEIMPNQTIETPSQINTQNPAIQERISQDEMARQARADIEVL